MFLIAMLRYLERCSMCHCPPELSNQLVVLALFPIHRPASDHFGTFALALAHDSSPLEEMAMFRLAVQKIAQGLRKVTRRPRLVDCVADC